MTRDGAEAAPAGACVSPLQTRRAGAFRVGPPMSKDETLRRLTARHLAEPCPELWLLAADRCEELGDEPGAALWRRRGELYDAVREQYDEAQSNRSDHSGLWGREDAAPWRQYGSWGVAMMRYPLTVRICARLLTGASYLEAGFDTIIRLDLITNVDLQNYERYVVRRLLGLIDRLT